MSHLGCAQKSVVPIYWWKTTKKHLCSFLLCDLIAWHSVPLVHQIDQDHHHHSRSPITFVKTVAVPSKILLLKTIMLRLLPPPALASTPTNVPPQTWPIPAPNVTRIDYSSYELPSQLGRCYFKSFFYHDDFSAFFSFQNSKRKKQRKENHVNV